MSISSTWKRLTRRFRVPTLAEVQVEDRKAAEAEVAEAVQMMRHNEYIRALAQAQLDAINNFEKERADGRAIRVS